MLSSSTFCYTGLRSLAARATGRAVPLVYERQVPHMQHTALILRRAIEYPPIIEHAAATCDQNKRYNIYVGVNISTAVVLSIRRCFRIVAAALHAEV